MPGLLREELDAGLSWRSLHPSTEPGTTQGARSTCRRGPEAEVSLYLVTIGIIGDATVKLALGKQGANPRASKGGGQGWREKDIPGLECTHVQVDRDRRF